MLHTPQPLIREGRVLKLVCPSAKADDQDSDYFNMTGGVVGWET